MFWRISWSLERHIRQVLPDLVNPGRILEFGPGRSTRVLAETFPRAEIHSLEHQEAFYLKHQEKLRDLPQVKLYHCPLDKDGFYSSGKWQELGYDLILVDGPPKKIKPLVREGASCVFGNLAAGGLIILDDSHRPDEQSIIARWTAAFELTTVHAGGSFTVLQKGSEVHAQRRAKEELAHAN